MKTTGWPCRTELSPTSIAFYRRKLQVIHFIQRENGHAAPCLIRSHTVHYCDYTTQAILLQYQNRQDARFCARIG